MNDRAVIEAIQGHLGAIADDLASQAESLVEAVSFNNDLSTNVRELRSSVAELHDKFDSIEKLLGNYAREVAALVRDTNQLRSEVREKLRVVSNG